MWNTTQFPCVAGNVAHVKAWLNGKQAGNASSCQLIIQFFNAAGDVLDTYWSPVGADETFYEQDSISRTAPANSAYFRIGVIGHKRRSSAGAPALADDFELEQTTQTYLPQIGINVEVDIPLSLTVRDGYGRLASWSGVVRVLLWDFLFESTGVPLYGGGGTPAIGEAGLVMFSNSGHSVWNRSTGLWTDTPVPFINSAAYDPETGIYSVS